MIFLQVGPLLILVKIEQKLILKAIKQFNHKMNPVIF